MYIEVKSKITHLEPVYSEMEKKRPDSFGPVLYFSLSIRQENCLSLQTTEQTST